MNHSCYQLNIPAVGPYLQKYPDAMPSRKYQPKRKHGCKTCKQRKVRCGLEKPICNNCKRLERLCIYDGAQKPPGSSSDPQTTTMLRPSDVLGLRLMHHYTATTCFHMSDNPEHLASWQYTVPQIAFKHPFLLRGILAVSALHLLHEREQKPSLPDLFNAASDHQQQALAVFIPQLSSITHDNCHALFAFAFLVGNTAYALLDRDQSPDSEDEFLESLISVFQLLRGAMTVAVQARDWLRAGELVGLLDDSHPLLDRNLGTGPVSLTPDLQLLLSHVDRVRLSGVVPPESTTLADCRSSLEKLNILLTSDLQASPRIGTVMGWPVLLRDDYLSLLQRRDPAALVVLAYYGLVLHQLDDVWWLRGLGTKTVSSVAALVGDEWLPHLKTPLDAVLAVSNSLV